MRPNAEAVIGIVALDSHYPKVVGNMANPDSFPFPVRFETADVAPGWWLDEKGPNDERLQAFLAAAHRLQDAGAAAITTTCGLFAVFQDRAALALDIPVFTTPLMLIPMVSTMIGANKRVGVVTAAGNRIKEHGFLENSGVAANTPLAVAAVDACPEFLSVIRTQQKAQLDSDTFEAQLIDVVTAMLRDHPDVGALVLECSDIPPYAAALAAKTGLPTFDFVSLTGLVHAACSPPVFPR